MDAASEKRSFSANRAARPREVIAGPTEKQSFSARRENGQQNLIAACSAAVEELGAARRLIGVLERENGLLKDRLETEKRASSLLAALNESRRAENEALRNAIAAKNETLDAKDAVIESQEKLIAALGKRKTSPWKRLGDVLIGVAAGAILK